MRVRTLTNKEQALYDGLILIINQTVKTKKGKETIINGLDELIDLLMNPYMDIDEAAEYFGVGK